MMTSSSANGSGLHTTSAAQLAAPVEWRCSIDGDRIASTGAGVSAGATLAAALTIRSAVPPATDAARQVAEADAAALASLLEQCSHEAVEDVQRALDDAYDIITQHPSTPTDHQAASKSHLQCGVPVMPANTDVQARVLQSLLMRVAVLSDAWRRERLAGSILRESVASARQSLHDTRAALAVVETERDELRRYAAAVDAARRG